MKTIKITTLLFLLLAGITVHSQSNYERGFKVGYTNGACFDKEGRCTISIPDVKGRFGKFRDGYAIGFETALKEKNGFDYKSYYKEYINTTGNVRNTLIGTADINALNKALEMAQHYYLIGDYEKCISISEILSNNLAKDHRPNMFKGLSLIELEDFKQGRNFLTWAVKDITDASLKTKLEGIIASLRDGTYKSSKLKEESAVTGTASKPAEAATTANPVKSPATQGQVSEKQAIAAKSASPAQTSYNSGNAKFLKGDFSGAIADFTASINTDPALQTYYMRALAKQKLSDGYGALNDYKTIISSEKKVSFQYLNDVYMNYSVLLINQKKYSEAISSLDAIILSNDKTKLPDAFFYRGIAKINSGDKEGGCTDLSKSGEMGNKEAYVEIKKSCQ